MWVGVRAIVLTLGLPCLTEDEACDVYGKLISRRGSSCLSLDTEWNSLKSRLPTNALVFNVGDSTLIKGDVGWEPPTYLRMGNQRHGGRRLLLRRGGALTRAGKFEPASPPERNEAPANGPVFSCGAPSTYFSSSVLADHRFARWTSWSVTGEPGRLTLHTFIVRNFTARVHLGSSVLLWGELEGLLSLLNIQQLADTSFKLGLLWTNVILSGSLCFQTGFNLFPTAAFFFVFFNVSKKLA